MLPFSPGNLAPCFRTSSHSYEGKKGNLFPLVQTTRLRCKQLACAQKPATPRRQYSVRMTARGPDVGYRFIFAVSIAIVMHYFVYPRLYTVILTPNNHKYGSVIVFGASYNGRLSLDSNPSAIKILIFPARSAAQIMGTREQRSMKHP